MGLALERVGGGFEGVEGLLEEIYLPVEPLGETERDGRTFDRGCLIPCSVNRSNAPACALGKIPANEDLWGRMRIFRREFSITPGKGDKSHHKPTFGWNFP